MDEIEDASSSLCGCEASTSEGAVRRRDVAGASGADPGLCIDANLSLLTVPEFKTVLPGDDSVDEDSDGNPLPGTPEEESLMDPKVTYNYKRTGEVINYSKM